MTGSTRVVTLALFSATIASAYGCGREPSAGATPAIDSAFARAESTYWRGEHDSARAEWSKLLADAQARGDSASMGRALTRLANVAWKQSDYPLARALVERALTMRLRPADRSLPYNTLGLVAYNEGRHTEAGPLFDTAVAVARRSGDSLGVLKATMNRALIDTELGDIALARRHFIEARLAARALGDTRNEAKCLANRGMLEIKAGDPLTAIALLDTARAIYRRIRYPSGETNALGQLGVAYAAIGEPQRALAALDTALTLSRDQRLPQEEASNLQLLAEQYRDAGDFTRALDYLARAQVLNEKLGMDDDRATVLRDEAEVHFALGQTPLALTKARQALALHRQSESLLEEMVDLLLLAQVHERHRRTSALDSTLAGARGIAKRLGTRDAQDRVALTAAEIADRSGTPADVLRALESADGGADQSPAAEARGLALRARAYRRLGRLDSAVAIGRRAVRAVEMVRGRYTSDGLRTAYAWENGAVYADLVLVLLRQGRVAEAFAVADAARGRALLEHLAEARTAALRSAGAARDLIEGESLLRYIDELAMRLRSRASRPPNERGGAVDTEEADLVARLSRARGDYEALLDRVAVRDGPGFALLGGATLNPAEVRSALRPDEALLEYFVSPDQVLAFVVTREAVRAIPLRVGADEVVSRARLARELLGRGTAAASGGQPVLASLYADLIAPVHRTGALARATRLVIVPHGPLAYLPFAALRDPTRNRFLVEDYTPIYVPSAAAFVVARQSRGGVSEAGAAVALAPFPDELPATADEVTRIARAETPEGIVLRGRDATERALRRSLETAPLVHVATHSELNVQNPLFSHIALAPGAAGDLADDGRLEVHELLGIHSRARLVFLSGCETGVGAAWSTAFRRGEDVTTLSQAFLYAGARSVIATLWRIEDGAAGAFATRFYEGLRTLPAPEALAHAQRSLLHDQRYAAPYDWAAYVINGDDSASTMVAANTSGTATPRGRPAR